MNVTATNLRWVGQNDTVLLSGAFTALLMVQFHDSRVGDR